MTAHQPGATPSCGPATQRARGLSAKDQHGDDGMIHDVSIPAAMIAGLVSFLSPCVLPLVPPYLIYLTGATIEHVANDETTAASKRAAQGLISPKPWLPAAPFS